MSTDTTAGHCTAPAGCTKIPPLNLALCRLHAGQEGPGQWLADIHTLWTALDPRHGTTDNGGRPGSLASQRSPVRTAVTVLTDRRRGTGRIGDDHPDPAGCDGTPSVYETLHTWATEVRQAHRLSEPVRDVTWREWPHPGPVCEQDCGHASCRVLAPWLSLTVEAQPTVETERQLLADWLEWCTGQGWWDEMRADLRRLWSTLRTVHGEPPPTPAASCWLPADDGVCGGPIWSDPGQAWCGKCRASWTGLALLRIRPVLDGAA